MSSHALATRSDSISHIGVHINDQAYVLTTVNGRADVLARAAQGDRFVTIWLASKAPPVGEVRDVLETAGFELALPHGRAQ